MDEIYSAQSQTVLLDEKPSGLITVQKLQRNHRWIAHERNYQILWLESGVLRLEGEFGKMSTHPGSIVFLYPERTLCLRIGLEPPKGWILKFSKEFFRTQYLNGFAIQHADIFLSGSDLPCIVLSPKIGERISSLAEMIHEVMQSDLPNKELAASSLLSTILVYCDSKCNIRVNQASNTHYLDIVSRFKQLVALHLTTTHRVAHYAGMMHVTPKYLNQVVKEVMGVTAKYVIMEQLLFKASRELKFSNQSVKEIAFHLGFSEPEHFSNFFKSQVGCSPSAYRLK